MSGRGQLKCDGTRAETRFRLSEKRTSPFKSARASVQSTTGSRGVRISGTNAGYTTFRVSVKSTGYPLHSPVSPSLPLPCVTVCHHISTGLYLVRIYIRTDINTRSISSSPNLKITMPVMFLDFKFHPRHSEFILCFQNSNALCNIFKIPVYYVIFSKFQRTM